ncbi:MAG: ATP phosphoribosyltransferase regulatory subunit [Oscillospiraceae bacterium]|nr:ATP phosphoribosyltransferase regulatory subunit [Oscillospiraceae bacterium]
MNKYDKITPEGTRDALFAECTLRRQTENRLHGLFTARGYSEIITPTLEFYDVFNREAQPFPMEKLYKLTDSKGRLMVLRPDNTVPIARVCATRLRNAALPLRLCYQQTVYLSSPSLKGRDDEITQAGIELIGSDSRMADLEVIAAAADALQACGEEYRLELGNAAFFRELMSQLNAPDHVKETIRDCIEAKNYPALGDILDAMPQTDTTKALRMLPRLFGGEEVFAKAAALCKGQHFASILGELHTLWTSVAQFAGKERVTVDLGMMHRTDYYTGMILRGYLAGYGEEILSGGRYDKLLAEFGYDVPATGFAVNIDAVVKVLSRQQNTAPEMQQRSNVLIWAAEGCEADAVEAATNLRKKGLIVEHSLSETLEGAQKYAAEHGIDSVLPIEISKANIKAEGGAAQ